MAIDLGTLVPGLARISRLTGRPVPARWPITVEEQYRQRIRGLLEPLAPAARVVLAQLPRVVPEPRADGVRLDADDGIARAVGDARAMFDRATGEDDIERVASAGVNAASGANRAALSMQLGGRLGVDPFGAEPGLKPILADATRENVALIRTIPERYFGAIETIVREGVRRGLRHEEVAKRIERDVISGLEGSELAIARNRAGLIARDQVGKVTARVGEHRQRALGVVRYRWVTSRDERVRGNPAGRYPDARPSHHARDGKVFDWSAAPDDGHPGEPINCRCIAEPVLDDIDDAGEDRPGTFSFDPRALAGPVRARAVASYASTPTPAPQPVPVVVAPTSPGPPPLDARRAFAAIASSAARHAAVDVGRARVARATPEGLATATRLLGRAVSAEDLADLAGAVPGGTVEIGQAGDGVRMIGTAVHPPTQLRVGEIDVRITFDAAIDERRTGNDYESFQRFEVQAGARAYRGEIGPTGVVTMRGAPVKVQRAVAERIAQLPYTYVRQSRSLSRTRDGRLDMHNNLLQGWPPRSGIGRLIFARQVAEARRLGVHQITTLAAREEGVFNGYYTWARFGYDGPLRGELAQRFGVDTIQGLMSTPAGRAAWREEGTSWDATFDLSDASVSMKALDGYLAGRGAD